MHRPFLWEVNGEKSIHREEITSYCSRNSHTSDTEEIQADGCTFRNCSRCHQSKHKRTAPSISPIKPHIDPISIRKRNKVYFEGEICSILQMHRDVFWRLYSTARLPLQLFNKCQIESFNFGSALFVCLHRIEMTSSWEFLSFLFILAMINKFLSSYQISTTR